MKNDNIQLIVDAEVEVQSTYKIGKDIIIYNEKRVMYPFFELLVNQIIEILQIKLGTDYFKKQKKEQQILSTIQFNLQKVKQNVITTDKLIFEIQAVLDNSRVIFFGFFEFPQLYGRVFNVFFELLLRYKVLINYGRTSKNQYIDFLSSNNQEAKYFIDTSQAISLKLKTIEVKKIQAQNDEKNKGRDIWIGRFSSICTTVNNNRGLKYEAEENEEPNKLPDTTFN